MTKFKLGKTYPSRDGSREYSIVAFLGAVDAPDGILATYNEGGIIEKAEFHFNGFIRKEYARYDMVLPKREGKAWIVAFKDGSMNIYDREEDAIDYSHNNEVIPIKWEEDVQD